MHNHSWGLNSEDNKELYVVVFVSRKKDNLNLEGFKERRKSFITSKSFDDPILKEQFSYFVSEGLEGEFSRMYYSVNSRDPEKVYKELLHFLIDNPDFNLSHLDAKLAGIAATKECAKSKKWLFDFDLTDEDLCWDEVVHQFSKDVLDIDSTLDTEIFRTPLGFGIITSHGFDTRDLMTKWEKYITLKRDDLRCCYWSRNEEEEDYK